MICTCMDWKHVKQIDAAIQMSALHSWGDPRGYTGKPWKFCPWCGKRLVKNRKPNNQAHLP